MARGVKQSPPPPSPQAENRVGHPTPPPLTRKQQQVIAPNTVHHLPTQPHRPHPPATSSRRRCVSVVSAVRAPPTRLLSFTASEVSCGNRRSRGLGVTAQGVKRQPAARWRRSGAPSSSAAARAARAHRAPTGHPATAGPLAGAWQSRRPPAFPRPAPTCVRLLSPSSDLRPRLASDSFCSDVYASRPCVEGRPDHQHMRAAGSRQRPRRGNRRRVGVAGTRPPPRRWPWPCRPD